MQNRTTRLTNAQMIIMCSFAIMFISRILVISGNYKIPINPVLIAIVYILIVVYFGTYGFEKIIISQKINEAAVTAGALILYVLLFCIVFVNPLMSKYASQMLQRQGMFVVLVILSAWIINKYNLFDVFLKATFVSISVVLLVQFIMNLSDLQFLNIVNIMSSTERTRGNFGFEHYNTLGGTCVCNILIGMLIRKRKRVSRYFDCLIWGFTLLSILMLLVSASRSSITSLGIYICLYVYLNLGKGTTRFLKIPLGCVMVTLSLFNLGMSFDNFLVKSNRFTLFDVALPAFFKSGRMMIGLGYAPTEVYGLNETPYLTYWLDNGYIYTLVTTGYIGSIIYIIALGAIIKSIHRLSKCDISKNMICIFTVYLYVALFETTLFTGTIPNYVYVILFLLYGNNCFSKHDIVSKKKIINIE